MQTNHTSTVKRDFLLNNSIVMCVVEIKDFTTLVLLWFGNPHVANLVKQRSCDAT